MGRTIYRTSVEGGTSKLMQPVKIVRIRLSDIPLILNPRNSFPQGPIREAVGAKMGTAAHDCLETETARSLKREVRDIFPTLSENKTTLAQRRIDGLPPDEGIQPLLHGGIAERARREEKDLNRHAAELNSRFGEQFQNGFPNAGETFIETGLNLAVGPCRDGLQVEISVQPDFITTISPTTDDYTTNMVVIRDVKNFPLTPPPKDTGTEGKNIDPMEMQRNMTMAAFANIAGHILVRRASGGQPQEDYKKNFPRQRQTNNRKT